MLINIRSKVTKQFNIRVAYCQIQGLVRKFQQGRDVESPMTVPLCSRILGDSLCLCLRSPWGSIWQMDRGDKQ